MKKYVCIVCPNGCEISIDEKNLKVTGNKCPRGEMFVKDEISCPKRTICTTVKTSFKDVPVLPVRVSKDIPKDRIFDVMNEINKTVITKKIARGDVVIKNVLKLGVDVIATSNKLKEIQ